jgi:hypothetical protein
MTACRCGRICGVKRRLFSVLTAVSLVLLVGCVKRQTGSGPIGSIDFSQPERVAAESFFYSHQRWPSSTAELSEGAKAQGVSLGDLGNTTLSESGNSLVIRRNGIIVAELYPPRY